MVLVESYSSYEASSHIPLWTPLDGLKSTSIYSEYTPEKFDIRLKDMEEQINKLMEFNKILMQRLEHLENKALQQVPALPPLPPPISPMVSKQINAGSTTGKLTALNRQIIQNPHKEALLAEIRSQSKTLRTGNIPIKEKKAIEIGGVEFTDFVDLILKCKTDTKKASDEDKLDALESLSIKISDYKGQEVAKALIIEQIKKKKIEPNLLDSFLDTTFKEDKISSSELFNAIEKRISCLEETIREVVQERQKSAIVQKNFFEMTKSQSEGTEYQFVEVPLNDISEHEFVLAEEVESHDLPLDDVLESNFVLIPKDVTMEIQTEFGNFSFVAKAEPVPAKPSSEFGSVKNLRALFEGKH